MTLYCFINGVSIALIPAMEGKYRSQKLDQSHFPQITQIFADLFCINLRDLREIGCVLRIIFAPLQSTSCPLLYSHNRQRGLAGEDFENPPCANPVRRKEDPHH